MSFFGPSVPVYNTPGINPAANAPQPLPAPFQWGQGGSRMTPEDILFQKRLAASQMAQGADYSPIQSPWQGLARVANGVVGGLEMRQANKAGEANADATAQITQALLADPTHPDPSAVAAALANPATHDLGTQAYEYLHPKPVPPQIERANNGDIMGLNPLTGEVLFRNTDPNPKPVVNWITAENPDHTKTLVPVGPNGPMVGGPAAPPATLPPDFDFGEGGPGGSPSGAGFH